MKYMLDANVLRHLAAHDPGYKNIILNVQRVGIKSLFVSAIVAAELHKAINNHKLERAERQAIKDMLAAISLVHFDEGDAEVSGEIAAIALRKGRSIPVPDYMVAGHALNLGFVMVTDNTKHFDAIEGLEVENWRRAL